VEYVRLTLVAANSLAFGTLGILSLRHRRREGYTWVRRMWTIVSFGCGAVVVGSLQRLALQAVRIGWLPEGLHDGLTGDLQMVQSLVVLGLIVLAFLTLTGLGEAMDSAERLTGSLLERVRHVDPARLRLTARESEVLALIGEGVSTDADLAAALTISRSTVQSHVKSLLRKTGLHRRTDLVAVAVLVGTGDERPGR
jgi:DNA-binding CsgD family transcriptional regulator